MKFVLKSELKPVDCVGIGYLPEIDFTLRNTQKFLDTCAESMTDEILSELEEYLNTLDNQGVSQFDFCTYRYRYKDERLSFRDLSSGERIYMIAFLADRFKIPVYLQCEVSQLTAFNRYKFLKKFETSEYITIVCIDVDTKRNFEFMLEYVGKIYDNCRQ